VTALHPFEETDVNFNHHINAWHDARMSPADVRHALDRVFQQNDNREATTSAEAWSPRVDICEDDQQFVILADIPGIDPAQIEVSMDKGVLSIKSDQVAETAVAPAKFTRKERVGGHFHRQFSLPDSADADGIVANGHLGVLKIMIPKKAQVVPRRITINTSH
jgi:HSP20 family protein